MPAEAPEYWPDGHCEQLVAPVVFTTDPNGQLVHTEADAAPAIVEYLPVEHPWHVESEMAPTAVENVPARQRKQVVESKAPVAGEYLPASQLTHIDCPAELWYVPALQFVQTFAWRTEYCPCKQDEQLVEPVLP